MNKQQMIKTLDLYQAWRTGQDNRMLRDIGITPSEITQALNKGIAILKQHEHEQAQLFSKWEAAQQLAHSLQIKIGQLENGEVAE